MNQAKAFFDVKGNNTTTAVVTTVACSEVTLWQVSGQPRPFSVFDTGAKSTVPLPAGSHYTFLRASFAAGQTIGTVTVRGSDPLNSPTVRFCLLQE
jgi:hypothetical protein